MRKKVIVVGGGLAGLSTALMLSDAGSDVTVIERREGVGLETSFANGGLLTASMSDPWNSPGVCWTLLQSISDPASAIKLRLKALPRLVGWGIRFLSLSRPSVFKRTVAENYSLASYSVRTLFDLQGRDMFDAKLSRSGIIKVFRDEVAMAHAHRVSELLVEGGCRCQALNAREVLSLEPTLELSPSDFCGGIYYPDDGVGDAHAFCRSSEAVLRSQSVDIHLNTSVSRLISDGSKVTGVVTDRGVVEGDAVVVASGNGSKALLATQGVNVSIQPVKGYSVTLPLNSKHSPPRIPIIDDARHAAVVPIGNRLRLVGTAEFCGYDRRIEGRQVENLYSIFRELLPTLASDVDTRRAENWMGFRPMSSDGKPYIGETAVKGLYCNTGHGHLGWTMALGSAALLRDCIAQQTPAVDPHPFRVNR